MSEKQLSQQESLAIISEMIGRAKSNYHHNGSFHFLLWGWVLMLTNLAHYYLQSQTDFSHPYIVWVITLPAGIISAVYGMRKSRESIVRSHFDRLYGHVWIAVGVGVIISITFMRELSFNHSAVILLLAAIGTYMSGQMLRFKPLMLGSVALALASIVCFMADVTTQYLIAGAAIFFGYLVPGYLLKKTEK